MPRYRFNQQTPEKREASARRKQLYRAKLNSARNTIISILDDAIQSGKSRRSLRCLRETLKILDDSCRRKYPTSGYSSTDSESSNTNDGTAGSSAIARDEDREENSVSISAFVVGNNLGITFHYFSFNNVHNIF